MQRFSIINILLCVLAIAFVAAGVFLMSSQISRENMYALELERAISNASDPDDAAVVDAEAEIALIEKNNAENTLLIPKLQEHIDAQNASIVKVQQKCDELAGKVDAEYYEGIIDSLSKGVSLVESYLNDHN